MPPKRRMQTPYPMGLGHKVRPSPATIFVPHQKNPGAEREGVQVVGRNI